MESEKKLYLICGHYGAGKTNVSVSLALDLKKAHPDARVTLVDLDIVNPYFRSADNERELNEKGVETILPDYANSNVDIPTLPPQILSVFEQDGYAVFDVGGDDSGATALGVYREAIKARGYELYIVMNERRPYIAEPESAVSMLKEIERASGLFATGIINNTNLGAETDAQTVLLSEPYGDRVCALSDLPLIATTVFSSVADKIPADARKRLKLRVISDATKKIF